MILFYILLKKFYHSIEGHTFLFWTCYIRYALLIVDKLPVELSLLMSLIHLPLEITNRFIQAFLHNFAFFIFFIMNVR